LTLLRSDQNSLSIYNGISVVTLEGVIDADPDLRANSDRIITPDRPSRPIEGVILVRPSCPAAFRYGNRLRVTDQLSALPTFAAFNYADRFARQGVYSMVNRPRVSAPRHDREQVDP
jgi:hypothetical protein